MGLTIHYTLTMRQPLGDAAVPALVAQARAFARQVLESGSPLPLSVPSDQRQSGQGLPQSKPLPRNATPPRVSRLLQVGPDFPLAHEWVVIPQLWGGETHVDVPPQTGHVFSVNVGQDCEPLLLGLCRYPATARHRGRDLPTKVGVGWRLRYFCKTQYASLHGWEYFLHCHRTVIDLLNFWRTLGVQVRISDGGGYWPRRSVATLRRNLDEMNGIVAAMGGALKDAGGEAPVESPIFRHPQFERLEAAGARRHVGQLRQAVEVLQRAAREVGREAQS
jgi:hypothetical protein